MRHLFADTFYWVALFSPRDRWHEQALAISRTLGEDHLWTTDEVLTEFLAICSAAGPRLRQRAVNLVRRMLTDPGITVLPQTHAYSSRVSRCMNSALISTIASLTVFP